ncbi:MAG: helix-turn-helix transcriptional regulator [Muribaculaceae bacterium]|nr:helix-turn-helix transcriptional regulator [Muribaculaceae bacterium]
MRKDLGLLPQLIAEIPTEDRATSKLTFAISDKIFSLMQERGLSKKQFADALGRRPSEITKWLSGEHNFTISTLAMLSNFFGKPIINV